MLRRNRVLFFIIIGVALLLTVGTLAAERLNIYTLPSRAVPQAPITVAVPPALTAWAEAAARDFNSSNPDAQVSVIAVNGLTAVAQFARDAPDQRPHAWIPEATFVAVIAQDSGLSFAASGPSLGSSELVWGTFESRAQALGSIDWQTIHDAATASGWGALNGDAEWGYFKLTMASPTRSAEGMGALLSAAATYHDTAELTRAHVIDTTFLTWLHETVDSVPNFNTLGPNPAEALATRGPSVGDVGILTAADWFAVQDDLGKWEPFVMTEPHYSVQLDYPYLSRANLASDKRAMVDRFGNYLAGRTDQLAAAGFRSQPSSAANVVKADDDAVLALMRWAEREGIGR